MNTSIRQQLTSAGTLEQNGIAERTNRKLIETTKCMALQATTPRFMWMEAINMAAFLINCLPTVAISSQVIPFQLVFGKKLDILFLSIYG